MRPPLIPQPIPFHGTELEHVKLLKTLYNALVEYREPSTGRIPISIFMCLPSRKDFPEYFDIIQRPISMYEIRKRIENGMYLSEDPCLHDFKLMFSNCRTFNEDGSLIFHDAVELERLLFDKYEQNKTGDTRVTVKRSKACNSPLKTPSIVPISLAASTTAISTPKPPPAKRGRKPKHLRNTSLHQTIPRRYIKKSLQAPNDIHQSKFSSNHSFNNHAHLSSTPYAQRNNDRQSYPINNNNNINHNGLASDADSNSNSNHYSSCNGNTNDSFVTNHSFHNDASIDSNSNLSIGPLASSASTTDKQSKRLKRDPDTPKRRLLTGYIIYAAEVRKEYVDKHPTQDFGFISRLIGNDWKALPKDLRIKYDQRALVHNKKMREKAIRDSMASHADFDNQLPNLSLGAPMTNGSSTPRLSKKKLAKIAAQATSQATHASNRAPDSQRYPYTAQQGNFGQQSSGKSVTIDTATQTAPFRFVEPPSARCHADAETFKRYIEGLGVSNMDSLAEEVACYDKPPEPVESWLGAGTGRHGSTEAALWALRDFMLQDSETMRLNMQPYNGFWHSFAQ